MPKDDNMNLILETLPEHVKMDIKKAVEILKAGGCKDVFIFGSAVDGKYNLNSDIDLAISGCPQDMFFKLYGKLMMEIKNPIDLVDLDEDSPFVTFLKQNGSLVYAQ